MTVMHRAKHPTCSGMARKQATEAAGHFELSYAVTFTILFCALYLAGQQHLFSWVVLGMDILCLILRKPSLPVLYSAFLVSNEAASMLIVTVWMIGSTDVRLGDLKNVKIDKEIVLIATVILAISFAQAWRAGTVANIVISAAYLCFVCLLAFASSRAVSFDALLRCTCCFVIGQFIVSLLICAKTGFVPGDVHCGTLFNAHFFGVVCLVAFVLVVCGWRRGDMSIGHMVAFAVMLAFMMWIADAKAAIGAGAACIVVFAFFWAVKSGFGTITVFLWAVILALMTGSLLMTLPGARELLTGEGFPLASFFRDYVYANGPQNKFDFFMGTASQMTNDGHILFGYGLGTYGSRFANMLGYTYTYRDPSAFNDLAASLFSSRMIPEYIPFASAYNADLVSIIQWYSAVLTYPFSSIIALVGETGLFGVVAVGIVLRKLRLGFTSQLIVALFIGVCITDLYFDHLQVIGLVIAAVAGAENLRLHKSEVAADSITRDRSYC